MSQRLGMADGRCFTINTSSRLLNNYIMTKNGVSYEDNYSYRKLLQSKGPEVIKPIQDIQGVSKCSSCDGALLNVSDIY